ncbi:tRNA lysidine(34) synthetase TilS [Oceanibaculum pacificum]|uniref:tRNA(Ile)-lysidine synthase n=1 Tax=Oceanibaculum pacificum TaxID=580166 RepID=A0A154VV95_9PROT|nr:tRNA lysidine(34) synthetase TilS [Oceanibaculum pacificum]KZD05227.1 hypothetical protein AUP43_11825 [Oceanibaculum pacificum]
MAARGESQKARFAQAMAALGGFEPRPHLAIAVSGGSDSLALTLLAADWAAARGGRILALTVDHGLRAESAGEAATVGRWLGACGIPHAILRWMGDKPATGLQAAARAARYRLLGARCRAEAILHLLTAHQAEDQAETVALRHEAASGPDGLAGMAASVEFPDYRLLRPLLTFRCADLRAYLESVGQDWIEDPSNRDPRFARIRLRQALGAAAIERLLAEARMAGEERRARDRRLAGLLARIVARRDDGVLELDRPALLACDAADGQAVLRRCLLAVSGQDYPPRGARLERLWRHIGDSAPPAKSRTLGGCVVAPLRRGGVDRLTIRPERRNPPHSSLEPSPAPDQLKRAKRVASEMPEPPFPPAGSFRPLALADFAVARPGACVIS